MKAAKLEIGVGSQEQRGRRKKEEGRRKKEEGRSQKKCFYNYQRPPVSNSQTSNLKSQISNGITCIFLRIKAQK
ncbi:hypothetical protein D0A34_06585 [Microcoleus vaginatus PCC 9802]|nr:hypothetical protein D0A34_06585 [Microcoleus vaginatus PCC 9802]